MTARVKMAKTFMERYGFSDPDLKDKDHDSVLLELVRRRDESERILRAVTGRDGDDYEAVDLKVTSEVQLIDRRFTLGSLDTVISCEAFDLKCEACGQWFSEVRQLEKMIESWGSKGARTMSIDKTEKELGDQPRGDDRRKERQEWEDTRRTYEQLVEKKMEEKREEYKSLVESRPCHLDLGPSMRLAGATLVVEVKSSMPTYGELMRQMNFYRDQMALDDEYRYKYLYFCVYFSRHVCDYADVLLDQGIHCFHRPGGNGTRIVVDADAEDAGLFV